MNASPGSILLIAFPLGIGFTAFAASFHFGVGQD